MVDRIPRPAEVGTHPAAVAAVTSAVEEVDIPAAVAVVEEAIPAVAATLVEAVVTPDTARTSCSK